MVDVKKCMTSCNNVSNSETKSNMLKFQMCYVSAKHEHIRNKTSCNFRIFIFFGVAKRLMTW